MKPQRKFSVISWFPMRILRENDKTPLGLLLSVSGCQITLTPHLTALFGSACAIHAERFDTVVEQARKLVTHHQFNNEPLRILVASLASGLRTTDAFITSTLQKHLFREMKLSDTAVKTPEQLRWNPLNKRYAPILQSKMAEADEEEAPEDGDESTSLHVDKSVGPPLPAKENSVIIAIYGQICIAAKSYQSAICEYMPFTISTFADILSRSLSASCIRLCPRRPHGMPLLGHRICRTGHAAAV